MKGLPATVLDFMREKPLGAAGCGTEVQRPALWAQSFGGSEYVSPYGMALDSKGNVLLTGDLAHFRENYDNNGVPVFNTNRADTLASLDRFKQMAKNLNATVIVQHDPRDIEKLPALPASAK